MERGRRKSFKTFIEARVIQDKKMDTVEYPVSSRDITSLKNVSDGIIAVRFFDQETLLIDGFIFNTKKVNYSHWFFNGERLDLTEFVNAFKDEEKLPESINALAKNNIKYVAKTKSGIIYMMSDEDGVINEQDNVLNPNHLLLKKLS